MMVAGFIAVGGGFCTVSAQTAEKDRVTNGGAVSAGRNERPVAALSDEPATPPRGETLVIVADGESGEAADTVQERIRRGVTDVLRENGTLKENEDFHRDRVRVEKIGRSTYDVLRQFIVGGNISLTPTVTGVSMIPDRGDSWSLDLGGPFALTKLEIFYPNEEKPEVLTPEKDPDRFAAVTLGRYLIRKVTRVLGGGGSAAEGKELRPPTRFAIEYTDGQKSERKTIDVAQENSYWQVEVQGFTGDQKRLFDILGDPAKNTNPLARPRISERKLVLASMVLADRYGETTIMGNTVQFVFTRPAGSSPDRVWMKFPLDPEEVETELKKYREYNEFNLPGKITKESPSRISDSVKLAPPPTPAQWYEVSVAKDGVSFERKFLLDRIDAWKARQNKGIHYLLVWQTDKGLGGKPQAFMLVDQNNRTKWPVKAEEAKDWPVKIKEADAAPGR